MAIVVLADSLAFHGPERGEPMDHPRLWPNLVAAELGIPTAVFARQGWTARDAWWALTRDPNVWRHLPTAEAVLLATGGMDKLPTSIPTYVRTGLSFLPTERARAVARQLYLTVNPRIVAATGGPLRTLGARQTDAYPSKIVQAVRALRPDLPVAGVVTHRWASPYYPSDRGHAGAARRTRAWGAAQGVPLADWDAVVDPAVAGQLNPDGLHFGWAAHEAVARVTAETLRRLPLPSQA